MSKIYLIGGVPRSGKTYFAKQLSKKLNASHIRVDDIRFMLEKRFTDEESKFPKVEEKQIIQKHLESLIKTKTKYLESDEGFILEGDKLEPKFISQFTDDQIIRIILGYPEITTEEKFKNIRKHKNEHEWTEKLEDQDLINETSKLIKRSQKYQDECKRFNIEFIDTSYNYLEIISNLLGRFT